MCRGAHTLAFQLPRSCEAKCRGISFSLSALGAETCLEPMIEPIHVYLQYTLRYLDLGRLPQLETVGCCHLDRLVEARLPHMIRVADFADCKRLETLRIEGGGVHLLSADFARCKSLKDASLQALHLGACEELMLAECNSLSLTVVESALKRAKSLIQLDLRGMCATTAILTGLARAARHTLTTVDLSEALWLSNVGVLRLVYACPKLARCCVDDAKMISAAVESEVYKLARGRHTAKIKALERPQQ